MTVAVPTPHQINQAIHLGLKLPEGLKFILDENDGHMDEDPSLSINVFGTYVGSVSIPYGKQRSYKLSLVTESAAFRETLMGLFVQVKPLIDAYNEREARASATRAALEKADREQKAADAIARFLAP